jgi:hypothetical protein
MTLLAHRVETTLQKDGTLTLDYLPFRAGQSVEVIILPQTGAVCTGNPYPLRGTPVRYERPTEPVAEGDWEALP